MPHTPDPELIAAAQNTALFVGSLAAAAIAVLTGLTVAALRTSRKATR